ncbi:MAG: FKBP-type peptidyl-prolyl cis-trans isomerase [Myxococcota bacterium]|nr:FKBP-type peptidyl-prolyl cis-trans isomerase [Myxococcota bacterium]
MDPTRQQLVYALGVNIAQSLSAQGLTDFDATDLLKGLTDGLRGATLAMEPDEINATLRAAAEAGRARRSAANKEAGETFLAENASREGVTVLDSGLQYEVITEGSGRSPGLSDRVTTHYHGTLIDGTVFDSSVSRGQPATFGVNQVIKGWTEALQLMREGSKWRLFVPQELAYGANPRPGGPIEPYCALVFEVELISVA